MIKTKLEGENIFISSTLYLCPSNKELSVLPQELVPACGLISLIFLFFFSLLCSSCHLPVHPFGDTNPALSPWTALVSWKRASLSPGQQNPLGKASPTLSFALLHAKVGLPADLWLISTILKHASFALLLLIFYLTCGKKVSSTLSRHVRQRLYFPGRQGEQFHSCCGTVALRKKKKKGSLSKAIRKFVEGTNTKSALQSPCP